jgi:ADP-ribose pyrophosphatase YjhB (NUDIX family)
VGQLDRWAFCPRCASAIDNETARATCATCGYVAYAGSAPAVEALVIRDGRVLLARRAIDPGAGLWDLPGGFLDEGEKPADGLKRELLEETGLSITIGTFVGAFVEPYDDRFVLGLAWEATAEAGDARAADDVAELAWFAADELPPPEAFAFPHHPLVLSAWRQQQP